jgi:thioredoxin reductase
MLERARRNPKVRFLSNAAVTRWLGTDGVLSGLLYRDTTTGIEHQVSSILVCLYNSNNLRFLFSCRLKMKSGCDWWTDADITAHIPCFQLACAGAFLAIGHKPNTAFLGNQVFTQIFSYPSCQFAQSMFVRRSGIVCNATSLADCVLPVYGIFCLSVGAGGAGRKGLRAPQAAHDDQRAGSLRLRRRG